MADPLKTYAVIVGVDEYDIPGDAWSLPQARESALAFALWLRKSKVPAKNLYIVTSGRPRDLPTELENSTLCYPKGDVIRGLLANRLGDQSGDLLLVFWSGHGELAGHEDRLLLSNASNNLRATIRSLDLRNALASRPLRGFARKVLIVDACRAPGGPAAPPDSFSAGDFSKPTASFIQSAHQGDKATAGEFSSRLMSAFRVSPWPPDFEGISRDLNAEVERGEALRPPGRDPSTPASPAQPALFCDRTQAAAHFRGRVQQAFASSAARPVVCLAYAESRHRPDSLIDRLIAQLNLSRGTHLREKVVEWSHTDETHIRRQLAGHLLDEWNDLPGPAQFARELAKKRQPYFLIRHNVFGWQDRTAATLAGYLEFWRQWPLESGAPPVFVFAAIVQPTIRRWFRQSPDPRIPRDLRTLTLPDQALVINDVDLIDRQHLADLINEYELASSGTKRDEIIQEVLGNLASRPMADVERQLINIFSRRAS